jgi:hypothetical protein
MSDVSARKYSWGIDVSTTNMGISIFSESGKLKEVRHLSIKTNKDIPEEIRYLDKAKIFKEYVLKFKEECENNYDCVIDSVFIEAPLYFTSINKNTVAMLLQFNGTVCYVLDEIFGKPPYLITVHQSRKLFFPEYVKTKKVKGEIHETLSFPKDADKKHMVWEKVAELYPEIQWQYKKNGSFNETNYDISDSIVVGLAGLKVLGVIAK